MTKQERFESWFSTHPDFKVLAGMFDNPFSRKADGSYWLSVVRTASDAWQAAQQKEGYVLVPINFTDEYLASLAQPMLDEYITEYKDSPFPVEPLEHEVLVEGYKSYLRSHLRFIVNRIKAAQEPTHYD